jgi:tRNA/tmRNA/rRNA uracil-C5-methylase (TrmA/RlmC/RlmD family)
MAQARLCSADLQVCISACATGDDRVLSEGQQIELTIDKPVSGGRMIARHLGQVVLVRGAIPGERVTAWVERAEKRLAYAVTRDVLEPSPDRRAADGDPLCGGTLYAHIAYERQLTIKADVIRDAFSRIARHPVDDRLSVAGSPERGYRMRARLHVRGSRAGFYREATHQLCDAASTHQLLPATTQVVDQLARVLDRDLGAGVESITITENIAADERAAHLDLGPDARLRPDVLEHAVVETGLNGISARGQSSAALTIAGAPWVTDPLDRIAPGAVSQASVRRHADAFFQGNRYLLPSLVDEVIRTLDGDGPVLDLYAGVGLFSIAIAAVRGVDVIAVEGDRTSGADLVHNAREHGARVDAIVANVEEYLKRRADHRAEAIVVDPPRTGMSKEALERLVGYGAKKILYVSCDPPTLARDSRKLLDGGYTIASMRGFDLFPNTPHVEVVSEFVL